MKILVVVHGFPPAAQGGSEIYAHVHAQALRECGDEVLVLTREQDPGRPEYDVRTEDRDGLHIVWVNNTFRDTRTFEETYRNDAIGAIAAGIIDEFRPHVAHVHHLTCLSTTIVDELAVRAIPCFVTLHDYWFICHRGQLLDVDYQVCDGPESESCHGCLGTQAASAGPSAVLAAGALRAIERRLPPEPARQLHSLGTRVAGLVTRSGAIEDLQRQRTAHMRAVCGLVTHFMAPSRQMRERFIRFGVPDERISVVPYGFRHASFSRPERTKAAPLRIGFLGSLMVSKAPHVLLEAVRRLPPHAVTVDLFGAYLAYHGDDRYRTQLAPLLQQDGVRERGAIPHERVAEALATIDVLAVPSIWPENSPLVIQEAFLAGAPVVASRIGGIPESVNDGVNGLLFNPGDPEDLARVLSRLLHERGLLEGLRAGIPAVPRIEDDVRMTRTLYRAHSRPARPDASAVRVAAVVLHHRTPDDTLLAVRSLLASRRAFDDIFVVDNDRTDTTAAVRTALGPAARSVTVLHAERNRGFSGGMNLGIREAMSRGADRILLVNSDVFVPPDCLGHLERVLDERPSAGIAGPAVLSRAEPDRVASLGISYSRATGRMRHRSFGTLLAEADRQGNRAVDGLSGCLILVRRAVFDAIGLLDEDYFFSFEDLDFCLRAKQAGFVSVLVERATVYHEGGRSIGADSPRRLYFAARNHLLMARRTDSSRGVAPFLRKCSIVGLNVAHAVRSSGGSLAVRLAAVARGTRDYAAGRFGADPDSR